MATYLVVDCDPAKCVIIGEYDLPDGVKTVVARSPAGDFDVTPTAIYVGDKLGNGKAALIGISARGEAVKWALVQGFRAKAIALGRAK